MQFVHSQDPSLHATVEVEDPRGVLVVVMERPRGKLLRKAIDKRRSFLAVEDAWHAATKLLFSKGFQLCAPQEGPVQWLTTTTEPFPRGFPFALDPRGDFVWAADTGFLRRIRRGTLERDDVSLGAGVTPEDVVVADDGTAWAVVTLEGDSAQGTPPLRAPTGRASRGLLRVGADLQPSLLAAVPLAESVSPCVGVTRDGRVLGPHSDGAALYDPAGRVLRSFPTAGCRHWSPRAAVSPSGAWLVCLDGARHLRVEGPAGVTTSRAVFDQLMHLHIDDAGVCLANGMLPDGTWGLHRVGANGAIRTLSSELEATLTPAGTVLEVVHGAVRELTVGGEPVRELAAPELGMSRRGRARVTEDGSWVVRTDTHTLAEIDPARIP